MKEPGTGNAKAHGSLSTRNKRTEVGQRRYVRSVGTGFGLRPACGCAGTTFVIHFGDPLVCPDCGGARLTEAETKRL